jgi:hypothetical protein
MTNKQKNADCLARFSQYVGEQKDVLKKQYVQLFAQDLSRQQWDGCFQRNVLAVLEQVYDDALVQLQMLPFDISETPVDRGLSDLTKQTLAAFDRFVDDFLQFVVNKHRTSCALSNFPDEHKPDKTYVNAVKRDIAGLWQNFALSANAYFLECR